MKEKSLFVQMKLAAIHFFVVCSQIYQLRMKKKKMMAKNRSHSAVNYNREESHSLLSLLRKASTLLRRELHKVIYLLLKSNQDDEIGQ